jgi:hypothetical protein
MELCFSTSSIETCSDADVGGFRDSMWHPINVDERSIATVTNNLIFTKAISFIMARSLIFPAGDSERR